MSTSNQERTFEQAMWAMICNVISLIVLFLCIAAGLVGLLWLTLVLLDPYPSSLPGLMLMMIAPSFGIVKLSLFVANAVHGKMAEHSPK